MTDDDFDAAVAEAVALDKADQKLNALVRLRKSVLKERRLLRALTILSIIGTCAAIYLAVASNRTADEATKAAATAQKAIDAVVEARDASRIVACGTANDIARKHNDLVNGVENTLTLATKGNGTRTPEQQARVDAFLNQQIAQYEAIKVAIRDCSPAGIKAYYAPKENP